METTAGYRYAVDQLTSLMVVWRLLAVWTLTSIVSAQKIALPNFHDLVSHYPGYLHYGGLYRNHQLLAKLQLQNTSNLLIHDTSALRLSYTLNHIEGAHSLGGEPVKLSKFGHDSIQGSDGMQYIFLPIAYGPYLADKYGYPNISKLHLTDPVLTEHTFWGKQGILRVITYTTHGNEPKGHVALWDCDHFHESKDWIAGNSLLTVEFWQSPDSTCPQTVDDEVQTQSSAIPDRPVPGNQSKASHQNVNQSKLFSVLRHQNASRTKDRVLPKNARHPSGKLKNRLGKVTAIKA